MTQKRKKPAPPADPQLPSAAGESGAVTGAEPSLPRRIKDLYVVSDKIVRRIGGVLFIRRNERKGEVSGDIEYEREHAAEVRRFLKELESFRKARREP